MESAYRPDLLAGKTALVTGGSSGIGFAIAAAFLSHGARVVIWSRSAKRLAEAADQLDPTGSGVVATAAIDVRDREAVDGGIKTLAADGLDIVVNAAAGNFPVPFAAMSANAWDSVVDIVLHGTANVCRSLVGRMAAGSVINIVAGYAWTGAPGVSHSGAAKAGVLNLTRSLAVEWAPKIRVNAVSPGPIAGTEGMRRLGSELGLEKTLKDLVPLRRFGRPEEIADACLYLVGAADYVTGACLVVDGGQDAVGPFGNLLQA